MWRPMRAALAALLWLTMSQSAFAITGKAPPASGAAARAIVMLIDSDEDLCTATALSRDVLLTAAHCVIGERRRRVKVYQTGEHMTVRAIARHPRFDMKAYAAARATAVLAPARRVAVGETLTIAGFGVTTAFTPNGLGIPREAKLAVTGQPGALQIRLFDPETRNARSGLGACTGDSGAPAFDADGRLIGIVSWSTAPDNEDGCGGLTGLTPMLMYRSWIEGKFDQFR